MNGQHYNCTLAEYHADKTAWSHSQIEDLIRSPALFHGRHVTGLFPREESAAFDVGTVAHAVLAKGNLTDVVRIIPPDVLNDQGHRKGKAWTAWSEENAGFIQLTSREVDPILRMVANVNAACPDWITNGPGEHEYSIRWLHEPTGLTLRCRLDRLCYRDDAKEAVVAVDWKTTRACTPRTFASDMAQFGYHRQAAWYWDGCEAAGFKVEGFVFVAVDKTPAHTVRMFELVAEDIELGRQQNADALAELAYRLNFDDWREKNHGEILTIGLPEWARRPDAWEMA